MHDMDKRDENLLRHIKWDVYNFLVKRNKNVEYEYERYVDEHKGEHNKNRVKHWVKLCGLKWHYEVRKERKRMIYLDDIAATNRVELVEKADDAEKTVFYYENDYRRLSVNKFVAKLLDYDVISFDIFDTAVYRKVDRPIDVFNIMSAEMNMNDFVDIRKKAEVMARNIKEKACGTREVVLSEIYDVLGDRFDVDKKWMDREIELEIDISLPNEYILEVYNTLLKFGKKIVFMTDMYLPLDVIKTILDKNGYANYDCIILSNEYGLRKGDGTLQEVLSEKYPKESIIHIGDNEAGDVIKTMDAGLDAGFNPDCRYAYKEPEMENIAGSFYRAVIQTNMNTGFWNKDIYYTHGYRTGGIITAGYCEYINKLATEKNIDKILFCARDCDVINKVYNRFYNEVESEYINISRFAIFNITSEHYLYDLANRYIIRYFKMYRSSKTIADVLKEAGYGYLIEELEKYDIDRFSFPCSVDEKRMTEFIYNCSNLIYVHNTEAREAARKYFDIVIGNAKNVLVVDIGWSGTCITALNYFIQKHLGEKNCKITGALMCTNRNDLIKNSIQFNEIAAYINTPFENMDITRFVFPGPPKSRDVVAMDKLHMPFEYMFTSTQNSLLGYKLNEQGEPDFVFSDKCVNNPEQIESMQQGVIDFVDTYKQYTSVCRAKFVIPPYTAVFPLREAINHERYSYEIYKDFLYDAMSSAFSDGKAPLFSELFGNKYADKTYAAADSKDTKKILFVSPEMIYTGAPRSLLRMCKVARDLGYAVKVWSANDGPFVAEYDNEGFTVDIVPENEIDKHIKDIESFDMAICNTIVTSKYAAVACQYIPTVWYIREATNVPDFIRNMPEREYTLKNSSDICVVSDYAANALAPYADHHINVVHNCVEDETEMAVNYVPGTGEKIKFVQFGTIEYRKGYDVLLAAYNAMPEEYRNISELYFAGGFINSGTPFASYLFREMEGIDGVHYLGVVKGEQSKIETLSSMDVVVVASRDESCSLVALEGAMLSKPLIVTENVGAKYMVGDDNGYIVETGDVESLKKALMAMIDAKSELAAMGVASRAKYDAMAGMKAYTESMRTLFSLTDKKNTDEFKKTRDNNKRTFSADSVNAWIAEQQEKPANEDYNDKAIVSLTSYPGRLPGLKKCIDTIIAQSTRPKKVILWLSMEQFPNGKHDLPRELTALENICAFFEIRMVKEDLKPHKKYFYAMQEFPDDPVIIVDDDVYYDKHVVEYLMESYTKFPNCVSAMRANLIGFRRDGSLMEYDGWKMGYKMLTDVPSTQLIPTGVGGVLYPPHILPAATFNKDVINDTCLFCDDLWLKVMASAARVKTVVPQKICQETLIEDSQDVALWRMNVRQGNNNDVTMKNILEYYGKSIGSVDELLGWLRKDRFC